MLDAGLDLSRQRLDVHLLGEEGRTLEVTAATPEVFGLRGWLWKLWPVAVAGYVRPALAGLLVLLMKGRIG
jgi:hypothetical protein